MIDAPHLAAAVAVRINACLGLAPPPRPRLLVITATAWHSMERLALRLVSSDFKVSSLALRANSLRLLNEGLSKHRLGPWGVEGRSPACWSAFGRT